MSDSKSTILVLEDRAGFIGGSVARALAATDWATPLSAARLGTGTTDPDGLVEALDGVAAVVNCITGRDATIVDSARALFQAAGRRPSPPRIVHLSSLAVYGDADGIVDEAAPLDQRRSAYGEARLAAERSAQPGARVVILRHGLLYGPGGQQWTSRIADLLVARRLGDLGTNGMGYCNLVYIDDLCQAVLQAVRLPGIDGRIFNLALPQPPTWNEYLTAFARDLGTLPVAQISASRLALEARLFAPPLKVLELALARVSAPLARRIPQAIPPSLCEAFAQTIRLRVCAAEETLGIKWTPLEAGLRHAAQWYSGRRHGP